ncbi:hypothetical protein ABPG74_005078 [Tetrahymena malaccensis]
MAGFRKVNSSKSEYPTSNIPSTFTLGLQNDEEKEQILKKCYEKFLEFPLEHQQKIIQIIQPQPQVAIKEKDQILDIINYLIEKDKTMSQSNARQRLALIANKPKYEIIMRVFEIKFAQMSKSKEEMIKFCMRKAFKFVYDKIVSEKKQKLNKKEQKQLKNEYFGITNESEYALPFRDDSAEKTMNDDFLKKTFALNNFINDYKQFLENYDDILEKDNQKKIAILVDQILETPDENYEQGLLKIKRIPWSREILEQTKQLATFLLQKYGTINEQQMNTKPNNQCSSVLNKDVILQSEAICNDSSFNFQNSLATNNTLNKHKQILISYEEFKKLTLNFSKNPNFLDLASNLQRDFQKPDQSSSLDQTNFSDFQFNQQVEQILKNEPVISNSLNANQKHLTTPLASELNQNLMPQSSNIIKENQLMQSPEISRIQSEKNQSAVNSQTIANLEKSTQIKEQINDSTKINSYRDKTPEPSFKAFQSTSQFNTSPIGNLSSFNKSSSLPQKNPNQINNQQINSLFEQNVSNHTANPFNQVNLQGYPSQQSQMQAQAQNNNQVQSVFISPFQRPSSNILSPVHSAHISIDKNNLSNFNQNLFFQGIGINEIAQQMNPNNSDKNIYQPSLLQPPNNMNFIDQDSFDTHFFELLIQFYTQYAQQQQQQQQQNQINLINQDILGLQNLILPSNKSTKEFSIQDFQMQTKQYLQQSSNQLLVPQDNVFPSNEFFRERSLSLQQNQKIQLQQNLGQNSSFPNNIFSSVNDVNLEIPQQTILNQQDSSLVKRMNLNSQFYYPLTDSQLNIKKQPENIQINQLQNNNLNEEIQLKDIIKKESQQNLQNN